MNARQKIKKNRFGGMTPRLHGHTKIVFTDKFGRESVKLDKDNLVTDAIQKIFASNYFGSMDYSKIMPAIRKVVGGVILFEKSLGSDPSDIWIPKSYDNAITGHAGQTVPASLADDLTRGLPNSAASAALENGFKMVWNFPETQANGDIAAVGLCHSDFGDYALNNSDFKPLEMISNDSITPIVLEQNENRLKVLNVHDNVNGYSYSLYNDSTDWATQIYSNSSKFIVKRRKNQLLNNITVDMNHYLGNEENEISFELEYNQDDAYGAISNFPAPSIFIDHTNNLFWICFGYGVAATSGALFAKALAYDMADFIDGALVSPVKTQAGAAMKGAVMGTNYPTQGLIIEGPEGFIPAVYFENSHYNFGLASYDSTSKEFTLENITGYSLGSSVGVGARFPEVMSLGNYYLVRIAEGATKLFEVDTINDNINDYNILLNEEYISPFFMEDNNPIIGATAWTRRIGAFNQQKSGVAINKLYLATKNDLPAVITKSPANSMRVEYSLTYI